MKYADTGRKKERFEYKTAWYRGFVLTTQWVTNKNVKEHKLMESREFKMDYWAVTGCPGKCKYLPADVSENISCRILLDKEVLLSWIIR